jgi:hypothetical protein
MLQLIQQGPALQHGSNKWLPGPVFMLLPTRHVCKNSISLKRPLARNWSWRHAIIQLTPWDRNLISREQRITEHKPHQQKTKASLYCAQLENPPALLLRIQVFCVVNTEQNGVTGFQLFQGKRCLSLQGSGVHSSTLEDEESALLRNVGNQQPRYAA